MDILGRVRNAIARYRMLANGDSVLVALSGGPDSVALLHLMKRLQAEMRLDLAAVHINHRLRGQESDEDCRFCEKLCRDWAIDLTVVEEDIAKLARNSGGGLEETARDFRYGVFESLARRDGYTRVATGHHADDQVETVLFRLFRGTGRTGLLGIPARRGIFVRPLIDCHREEISGYLGANGIASRIDSSNLDSDFTRNAIRHKLLPMVRKVINPKADLAVLNTVELLAEEERFLDNLVNKTTAKVTSISPGGKIELATADWGKYDRAIRRRLLRNCLNKLRSTPGAVDRDVIERLDRFCLVSARGLSLPGELRAVRIDSQKVALAPVRRLSFKVNLAIPGSASLEAIGAVVKVRRVRDSAGPVSKARQPKTVELDAEAVRPPLAVRSVRVGDRFQPLGMRGTKKVGDYLTDRKLPAVYRDEIPVVVDSDGPIWLVGFEIADRVKVQRATERRLKLEFRYTKTASSTTH